MKTRAPLISFAVCGMFLAACGMSKGMGKENRFQPAAGDTMSVSGSEGTRVFCGEKGAVIRIENGNELTLMLDENPSTGYSWVMEDTGNGMLRMEDKEYAADEHEEAEAGYGGAETYSMTVLRPGEDELLFNYKQEGVEGESLGKYRLHVTAIVENGDVVVTDAEFVKLSP